MDQSASWIALEINNDSLSIVFLVTVPSPVKQWLHAELTYALVSIKEIKSMLRFLKF